MLTVTAAGYNQPREHPEPQDVDDTPARPPAAATRTVDRVQGATRVAGALMCGVVVLVSFAIPPAVHGFENVALILAGAIIGVSVLLFLVHPFRALGACPPAALIAAVAVGAASFVGEWSNWMLATLAFAAGVFAGSLIRYEIVFNPRAYPFPPRRVATTVWDRLCLYAIMLGVVAAVYSANSAPESYPAFRPYILGVLVVLLLVHTWTRLFRPFFELCVELVIWKGYRVTSIGEGQSRVPTRGPLLVIANHACWWDPLFLAKVLPRPVTPMMTSAFYDRWFLRPLMVYVFQTIRVADVHIRREAPEIQQAIQALDEGKCVVIFPEGFLRRKEEIPLRRFGRGVWEILKARPQTPVLACWIEGNWGSYASYWNGPPTKNKQAERRRPIRVGMLPPTVVTPEVLEQHLRTRLALMNLVSAAREPLGLPVLPPFEWSGPEEREHTT